MLVTFQLKHFTALFNLAAIKHIHVVDKHVDIFQLVATYTDDTTTILHEGSKEECNSVLKNLVKELKTPVIKEKSGD